MKTSNENCGWRRSLHIDGSTMAMAVLAQGTRRSSQMGRDSRRGCSLSRKDILELDPVG